jgi:hypothetical protein
VQLRVGVGVAPEQQRREELRPVGGRVAQRALVAVEDRQQRA